MIYEQAVNNAELQDLISNFTRHPELDVITTSFRLPLEAIDNMLNDIKTLNEKQAKMDKPRIDGLRFYFIRFHRKDGRIMKYVKNKTMQFANDDLTQASIAIVPTINYVEYDGPNNEGVARGTSNDLIDAKGNLPVFFIHGEHTGLCPVNCGGSFS